MGWVAWFNHDRINEAPGDIPPAHSVANHYRRVAPVETAGVNQRAPRRTRAVHVRATRNGWLGNMAVILTQRAARRLLGDMLVIRIDPRMIRWHVGTKWPVSAMLEQRVKRVIPRPAERHASLAIRKWHRRWHPFMLTDRSYPGLRELETTLTYRRVRDLIAHGEKPQDSLWYRELMELVEQGRSVRHKQHILTTPYDVSALFLEYLLPIIESMRLDGYLAHLAEPGAAMIGRDGTIHKAASGNHRFAVARELQIPFVPVRIECIHRDWIRAQARGMSIRSASAINTSIRAAVAANTS